MGDGPNDRGLSRKHVFKQLHASLKRLKQDYVDILYCHRYDPKTPVEETLRTIDDPRKGSGMPVCRSMGWALVFLEPADQLEPLEEQGQDDRGNRGERHAFQLERAPFECRAADADHEDDSRQHDV